MEAPPDQLPPIDDEFYDYDGPPDERRLLKAALEARWDLKQVCMNLHSARLGALEKGLSECVKAARDALKADRLVEQNCALEVFSGLRARWEALPNRQYYPKGCTKHSNASKYCVPQIEEYWYGW